MSEEWGPWIEHDGKGCPCVGQVAQWELDGGHEYVGMTDINGFTMISPGVIHGIAKDGPAWTSEKDCIHVIRYRIRKPKGLTILEGILENLPQEEHAQ